MKNNNFVKDGEIIVFVDTTLFSKEVVLKTLYWYGDKFHTNLNLAGEETYLIKLKSLSNANIKEGDLDYYLQKLERDLIDFHLREIINNETKNVRDLLVAKAFSNGEFDEAPPGEVSDTVGFDPHFAASS